MLAVEKIRGVNGIRAHGLETGKAEEWSRGPFPAVADEVVNTPGACAVRKRTDGDRIPVREIEVATRLVRPFFTPRKGALFTRGCSECGAVILGLARQTSSFPPRICIRFIVAGVHRPVERQRDQVEHAAPEPLSVFAQPEMWWIGVRGFEVLEVFAIRHVMAIDRERRNLDSLRGELVVPPERKCVAIRAERGHTRGYFCCQRLLPASRREGGRRPGKGL